MTSLTNLSVGTPVFSEAPTSVNGLIGFEPGSLILNGKDNVIFNSRRCSIINGEGLWIVTAYNTHAVGMKADEEYIMNHNTFNVFCDSGFFCNGDMIAFFRSDERLKKNKKPLTECLKKIKNIKPVIFDWNNLQNTYSGRDIGFLAQDVGRAFPQLVKERTNGYKSVNYRKIIAVLVQCIKENQTRIDRILKEVGSE